MPEKGFRHTDATKKRIQASCQKGYASLTPSDLGFRSFMMRQGHARMSPEAVAEMKRKMRAAWALRKRSKV